MMAVVLSCMVFIDTYQVCHKLLLYAHSFHVFLLLLSNRMFTLAVNIWDNLLAKNHQKTHTWTQDTFLSHVCMCVCVTKSTSFIAEQTYIIACTGSTGRKHRFSDSLQKRRLIPEPEQRSPAEGTSWNTASQTVWCRSFRVGQ